MQAVVRELWVYPIKSCQGYRLSVAQALPTGLQHDRCMMVVSADGGKMVSQRSVPFMALICPTIHDDTLSLNAPNQPALTVNMNAHFGVKRVTVWGDTLNAIDMGDEAALWFSKALKCDVRLVRFNSDLKRPIKHPLEGFPEQSHHFADGFPYLILSLASLNALNVRLTASSSQAIPVNRFRPNIVIDNVDEHTEDFSSSLTHANGSVFTMHSPCTRCNVPTIDQATAVVALDQQPTLALSTYRFDAALDGITFGMNGLLNQACELRVNDRLDVRFSF